MKGVEELNDIAGKKVLVRIDFNVPVRGGVVYDDFRIAAEMPTVLLLKEKGAKVILLSHIENTEGSTLRPIAEFLEKEIPIKFVGNDFTEIKEAIAGLSNGDVLLIENVRNFKGEKENDENLAKELAALGDYFVNEAFPSSHRNHASIVGIPKFLPSFIGLRFQTEIKELSKAFHPTAPFLFILGGAKFENKEPLIKKFLDIADFVFVGGALGNDFFKAKGYEVGGSIVSGLIPEAEIVNNEKVLIPTDAIVRGSNEEKIVRLPTEIMADEIVSDAGPRTLEMLREKINMAHTILWNGPVGFYEKGFDEGTKSIAKMLSECRGRSIVGGGDTVAAIMDLGIADRLSFISTGGGAMLYFLAKGTLPGIEALQGKSFGMS